MPINLARKGMEVSIHWLAKQRSINYRASLSQIFLHDFMTYTKLLILIYNFQIKEIIRQGVEVPEGQNDLRRMQLRELALLNGTLRENDGPRCSNCGASTHKSWQVR